MTRPLKKLSGSAEKTKEMLEELNKRFAYAKRHGRRNERPDSNKERGMRRYQYRTVAFEQLDHDCLKLRLEGIL
jgi:hypothetical protein